MQVSNKIIMEKKVIFVNDLQTRLSNGCATLKRCNNNIQFNGKQLQQKMIKNKSTMLTSNAVCNVKAKLNLIVTN